ncbi:glycosyltransferase family 4 protein [Pedobacter xixiisoli]|uniref:Glycosyltransferase involved in cell wall bisynthesis n=1 Tax=Pedobacter xixiisoli TaxID=1476464 RepID=A0A285ZYY4_9SPHI|nr:glycosyltransferase family 1 protein [Pedobacter xixiisoli]SOD14868.1 Glycosyltransferase involved in cell wall bisynthesis [Pedobacter xixiisoli]
MKAESRKQTNKAESTKLEPSSLRLSALGFKLKIGYDGKRAANNLTGLGNYSRFVIESLALNYPENKYFVYTPKVEEKLKEISVFSLANVLLSLPKSSKFLWRALGIKKQLLADKIDLFHGLSHEIPLGLRKSNIKSIVTIHDLIFLRKPNYYKFIDRKIYELKSRYACKNSDRIIAISERTKLDIIELYQIPEKKIDIVYQGCEEAFKIKASPSKLAEVREKYQLPNQFILSVGTIEERKNLNLAIEALSTAATSHPLVVVGKTTTYLEKVKQSIEKYQLQHRVIFLHNVTFNDLPAVYQSASLFVYPSFYEGFGIPIIEAINSEVPVIAASGSCLEEAGGPDSIYVSPSNPKELASAIDKILADENLRQEMVKKSLKYVQKFNNDFVAKEVMKCYQKAFSEKI